MTAVCLSFAGRKLTEIPQIPKGTRLLKLNVSNNPITDLRGMNQYRCLEALIADNTKLLSFKGAVPQQKMTQISAKKTPLGSLRLFPLMALIAFGDDLTVINDQTVTDSQRLRASKLRPFIADYLIDGWVVMSLCPVVLLDPVTRRRRRLYTPVSERALAESQEVVIVREEETSSDDEEAKAQEEAREKEDEATKELRQRFDRFQREVEASRPRRPGSPVRCLSRQSKATLRNSMRSPVSPEQRNVSPVRERPFKRRT